MRLLSPIEFRRKNGSAVIVLLALLSIMVLFVFANLKTLSFLGRELKLVEKRQVERLQTFSRTNAPLAAGLRQTSSSSVGVAPQPDDKQQDARN